MVTKKSEAERAREVAPTPPKEATKALYELVAKGRYCTQCKMVIAPPVYAPVTPEWLKRHQPGCSERDDEAFWEFDTHGSEASCIRALGAVLADVRRALVDLQEEFNEHRRSRDYHDLGSMGDQ